MAKIVTKNEIMELVPFIGKSSVENALGLNIESFDINYVKNFFAFGRSYKEKSVLMNILT